MELVKNEEVRRKKSYDFSKKEEMFLFIEVVMVAIANVFFYDNKFAAYFFVALEVFILAWNFIHRQWVKYLGNYIVFCGMSLEFAETTYAEVVYSFKEIRFAGLNLGVLALVPLVVAMAVKFPGVQTVKKRCRELFWFSKMYLFIIVTSLLVGIVLVLANDNGVQKINAGRIIFEELYQRGFQPLMLIFIVLCLITKNKKIEVLSKYLEFMLIGIVIAMVLSFSFGKMGYYGGVSTLLVTVNIRWVPLLLIFPLYSRYKGKFRYWLFGIIGMVLSLRFNATGKTIIVYALIPIIYIVVYFKSKKYDRLALLVCLIPVLIVVAIPVISHLVESSILFASKLRQVKSIIGYLFNPSDVQEMLSSPRTRIYEFINITNEYIEKPYLLLFGKGLGGTIKPGDMPFDAGAFTELEWNSGLIYNLHESLAKLYLSNGLCGVFFFINTVWICVKKISNSPWVVIGAYWFVISFGFSITMTSFCMVCLLYGLSVSDQKEWSNGGNV